MTSVEPEKLSTKDVVVRLAIAVLRIFMSSHRAKAPEKMRTDVKVAASMLVCLSAARQSRELLAKAIIADNVSVKIRVDFITHRIKNQTVREAKSEL